MSDTDLTGVPIAIVSASSPMLGDLDQLTKLASDVDLRFTAGKNARLAQVGALDARTTALEARAPVPGPAGSDGAVGPQGPQGLAGAPGLKGDTGLTGAVGPQGPVGQTGAVGPKGDTGASGAIGPQGLQGAKGDTGAIGPTGATGAAGTNANLVAATLATLGSIKANVTLIQRTTTPISVNLPAISVLGLTALVATTTATVTGVQIGDAVQAVFSGVPPVGLIPTGAQVTAANTVLVTFSATQAVALAAGAQSLNFFWMR